MKSYYRKGARVIYNYKVWRRVYWSDSGYGWVSEWKRATVVCTPRDCDGRFTSDENEMEFILLKDEKGNVFNAMMDEVEKDRDIFDLTREELMELWRQVCKGSLYYSDYRNSLGVFENNAMEYWEGFYMSLVDEYGEEKAEEMDTAEGFADFVEYELAVA